MIDCLESAMVGVMAWDDYNAEADWENQIKTDNTFCVAWQKNVGFGRSSANSEN